MTTTLRDGSSLILWRRQITAVHPALETVRLPRPAEFTAAAASHGEIELPGALGEHLGDADGGGTDSVMAERLYQLSVRHGGWLPGFVEEEEQRLRAVASAHARRRFVEPPRLRRFTLPASVIRRAQAITNLGCRRIFIDDDIDGLGVVLAQDADVLICEPDPARRLWLQAEAQRAEVAHRLSLCETAPETGATELFDLACVGLLSPRQSAAALHRATQLVGPGGNIAATFRPPWEDHLLNQLAEAGFVIDRHLREVDHEVLPGGFVLDSMGDLVLLTAPQQPAPPPANDPEGADDRELNARVLPYYWIEFDDLRAEQVNDSAIERLADCIADQSDAPEEMRSVVHDGDRQLLCWYNSDACGLTAELTPESRHILIGLMPYCSRLEYVVACATMHTLGDDFTYMRPRFSGRYGKESIVA